MVCKNGNYGGMWKMPPQEWMLTINQKVSSWSSIIVIRGEFWFGVVNPLATYLADGKARKVKYGHEVFTGDFLGSFLPRAREITSLEGMRLRICRFHPGATFWLKFWLEKYFGISLRWFDYNWPSSGLFIYFVSSPQNTHFLSPSSSLVCDAFCLPWFLRRNIFYTFDANFRSRIELRNWNLYFGSL